MIQIFLKNTLGMVTHTMNSLEELSKALNDPMVMSQQSITALLTYLLNKHYRTKINGVDYYMSNQSFGVNQPVTIGFTELEVPQQSKQLKLMLENQSGSVILEKEISLKEFAGLLNDEQIMNCENEAVLEFYLVTNHMRVTIDGEQYKHKGTTWSAYHLPVFTFVKI